MDVLTDMEGQTDRMVVSIYLPNFVFGVKLSLLQSKLYSDTLNTKFSMPMVSLWSQGSRYRTVFME